MPDTEPTANRVFAALPVADQAALRPHLQKVFLSPGQGLNFAGEAIGDVYFQVRAVIANITRHDGDKGATAGAIGREGITGLEAFLASAPVGWDIEVLLEGLA